MRITRNLQYEYILGFTTMGLSDSSIVSRRDSRGKTQLFGAHRFRFGLAALKRVELLSHRRYLFSSFVVPVCTRSPSEKHGWRVFGGMMGPAQ